MEFLKKNWSNILLLVFIALLFLPQTRKPIQIGLNRLIAFSPPTISNEDQMELGTYNWELRKLDEQLLNLKQSHGKVTLINFWATWCPPCIAEMPSFQKLYNDYGDRVDFYFVSTEEAEKLSAFLEKKDYRLPIYQPLSMPPDKLQSASLPTTYLLSKSGKIVVDKTGAANWNDSGFRDILDQLLLEEY